MSRRDPDEIYDFGGLDVYIYEVDGMILWKTVPAAWSAEFYDSKSYWGKKVSEAVNDYRNQKKND